MKKIFAKECPFYKKQLDSEGVQTSESSQECSESENLFDSNVNGSPSCSDHLTLCNIISCVAFMGIIVILLIKKRCP